MKYVCFRGEITGKSTATSKKCLGLSLRDGFFRRASKLDRSWEPQAGGPENSKLLKFPFSKQYVLMQTDAT